MGRKGFLIPASKVCSPASASGTESSVGRGLSRRDKKPTPEVPSPGASRLSSSSEKFSNAPTGIADHVWGALKLLVSWCKEAQPCLQRQREDLQSCCVAPKTTPPNSSSISLTILSPPPAQLDSIYPSWAIPLPTYSIRDSPDPEMGRGA